MSAPARAALRTIQSTYWAMLNAWTATPSEKHKQEIQALFQRGLLPVRARGSKVA